MRRRSEFMVGEKFRVRVVLSEDLKNHSQYDLFKKCRSSENDVVKDVQVKKSVKSDFILFIRSGGDCGSEETLAAANYCQQDLDTDRPIAGSIALCSAMKFLGQNPGELKRVIIHELGHTFGFNYWLFPYLRHDDGSPRTRRNQHTGEPDLPEEANEGLKAD
ncbi:unnamed protein product, partial [Schistosoma spindalis]